ncbi:hypothetical protein [Jeotgalibacillus marinus]|uniref:Lipoprotein n=1 Tax=Jeotgalibacillus marinus TaxID=86667 RepID=A0ABV3Q070_9BACL
MKKYVLSFCFFCIMFSLSACGKNEDIINHYEGRELVIGVIGEFPMIHDADKNHATFKPLDTNQLLEKGFEDGLDAVFINKKFLDTVAENKYTDIFNDTDVAFVFIDSVVMSQTFLDKDVPYNKGFPNDSGWYLQGYYNDDKFATTLYNDQPTDKNIKNAYARMFELIEDKVK